MDDWIKPGEAVTSVEKKIIRSDLPGLESDSEDEVVVKKKKKTSASSQPEKKSKSLERKSPKVIKSK